MNVSAIALDQPLYCKLASIHDAPAGRTELAGRSGGESR